MKYALIGIVLAAIVTIGLVVWVRSHTAKEPEITLSDSIEIELDEGASMEDLQGALMKHAKKQGWEVPETTPIDGTPLYVKIPEALSPIDRGDKYEIPLLEALVKQKLGTVTGGGTMMDQDRGIQYCGLDVVVTDLEKGIKLIREVMSAQGAPKNTVILQGEPEIEHSIYEESETNQ